MHPNFFFLKKTLKKIGTDGKFTKMNTCMWWWCSVAKLCGSFANPWTVTHRLLCPWDFRGKNTGVGWQFLLQGIFPTHVEPESPELAGRFFTTEPSEKPCVYTYSYPTMHICVIHTRTTTCIHFKFTNTYLCFSSLSSTVRTNLMGKQQTHSH